MNFFIFKFIEIFDGNEEKILYLELTIFKLKNDEENILKIAEKLFLLSAKEEYSCLIQSTKERIKKNQIEKKNLFKKLIKNI